MGFLKTGNVVYERVRIYCMMYVRGEQNAKISECKCNMSRLREKF